MPDKKDIGGIAKGSPLVGGLLGVAKIGDKVIDAYKKHVPLDVRKKVRKGARKAWRKAKKGRNYVRKQVRKATR